MVQQPIFTRIEFLMTAIGGVESRALESDCILDVAGGKVSKISSSSIGGDCSLNVLISSTSFSSVFKLNFK